MGYRGILCARKVGCSTLYVDGEATCSTVIEVLEARCKEDSAGELVACFPNAPRGFSHDLRFSLSSMSDREKLMVDWLREDNNPSMDGIFLSVSSAPKGKGFCGVMKLHGFSGGNASHGASLSHRVPGSTGGCQEPGRVMPGKKMPGRNVRRSSRVSNLLVLKSLPQERVVFLKGAVPGSVNSFLWVF